MVIDSCLLCNKENLPNTNAEPACEGNQGFLFPNQVRDNHATGNGNFFRPPASTCFLVLRISSNETPLFVSPERFLKLETAKSNFKLWKKQSILHGLEKEVPDPDIINNINIYPTKSFYFPSFCVLLLNPTKWRASAPSTLLGLFSWCIHEHYESIQ